MIIIHSPFKLSLNRQLLCAAILIAIEQPAAALTLGELTVQSAVGQRFKGAVSYQLAPEDGLLEDCSKLSVHAADNDLPGLGSSSLRLQSNGRGGRILIQSSEPIFEPMASFSIKMECKGQQLQRSYTVFLDPAPLNPVTEAPRPTLPVIQAETRAQQPTRSKPAASKARTAAPATPTAKTVQPIPAAQPAALPSTGGQLRIESELSSKNLAPAVLSPEELQTKIAMMQSLQEQLQSEMIRLQKSMLQLQSLTTGQGVASSVLKAPEASLSIGTAEPSSPPATAAPITTSPPEPVVKRHAAPSTSNWWIALVLGLLASVAGGWIWLRRRQKQNVWDANLDSSISSIHRSNIKPVPNAEHQGEHSIFRHSQLFYGGIEVQEEDGSATLERAQLLVAQGETDQAIELLYITIDENETDTEPWLLLFRILRQQGMKTEYAQLARRFHDLNGDEEDWALVRNIGYRLDPDNPLYAMTEEEPTSPAQPYINPLLSHQEQTDDEPPLEIDLPEPLSANPPLEELPLPSDTEPQRPQDAMLMEFLTAPPLAEAATPETSTPMQMISLDLPPLEFTPAPAEENSALDLSLIEPPMEEVEEIIEASIAPDDSEAPFEEIDLVELDIELQPPLSFFEPNKK